MARRHRVVRELRHEVADRLFGIDADLHCVGADERARENAAGQPGNVVAFERLQLAHRNLGRVRDLAQGDASLLARVPHPSPKIRIERIHRCHRCGHVRKRFPACQTPRISV